VSEHAGEVTAEDEEEDRLADEALRAREGSMWRMLREAGPEKAYIAPGLVFLAAATVCTLAIPKLLGDFIDRLGGPSGTCALRGT
jgi:hypothetical protein